MTGNIVDTVDPLVRRLRALAGDAPELKDATEVYEAILPLLRDADLRVGPVALTRDEVRAKMESGVPILHGLALEIDIEAVHELMFRLAAAVEAVAREGRPGEPPLPGAAASQEPLTAAGRIRLALEQDRLDMGEFLPLVIDGRMDAVLSFARGLRLDPDLVWTLAQNALKPALRACCRQLAPLAAGTAWNRGACFVCGSVAVLAELQDNDQVKHLRCGSCGADWRFRRLQCMHCGNEDHRTQQFLFTGDRCDSVRLETCDQCGGYLKVISSFAPTPPELLPVEDLATLRLDYIAQERGYARTVNP